MNSEFAIEKLLVAGNRGPCGGVNMALEAANQVLDIVAEREPVFTNWDLVNNTPVMNELRVRGLVNVKNNWDLVPPKSIVFFSAHGVPPSFHQIAQEREYLVVDVTCQLVSRVHSLVRNAERDGKHIVYVGAKGHPEATGVVGELDPKNVTLVQTVDDVKALQLPDEKPAIVYSQTTLATDEIKDVMRALRAQNPHIEIPNRWDICYATDNRQAAVGALIPKIDFLLVAGSKHSHNSTELMRKGLKAGLPSHLIDLPEEVDPAWFTPQIRVVGITSGASVLERFTQRVVEWFLLQNPQTLVRFEDPVRDEKEMTFKLPQKDIAALRTRYQMV